MGRAKLFWAFGAGVVHAVAMHIGRRLRFAPICLGLGLVAQGAAGQTSVHGTAGASIAYTDNMLGTATDPPPGTPAPISVWFMTLTPGVELYSDSSSGRYFLSYGHPFTFYFGRSEANTDGDLALGRGIWALSSKDELLVSLGVTRTTSALSALQAPAPAGQALADGRSTLLGAELNQQLSRTFNQRWTGRQSAGYGIIIPVDTPEPQPVRYNILAGVGADYLRGYDAWGLDLTSNYFRTLELDEENASAPAQEQLILSVLGRYRRDLSQDWSSELRLGGAAANDLAGNTAFVPRWGASLFWSHDTARASLNYDRQISVSLITGQAFLSDTVSLTGGIPVVPDANILLSTSHGFSWNRVISRDQEIAEEASNTWTSEVALGWYPDYDLPQFTLRYQHFEQFNAPEDSTLLPNFHRNLVMLTVSGRLPARRMDAIPTAQPQRVDGGDRDPSTPGAAGRSGEGGPVDLGDPGENRVPEG